MLAGRNSQILKFRNFIFGPFDASPYGGDSLQARESEALSAKPVTRLAHLMTTGGDARILLDPETGLNRYHSGPYPRDVIAFASSTANDLSADAMAYIEEQFDDAKALARGSDYASFLDRARVQIRDAYGLQPDIGVFFAASGTDLEYVGLLAARI